MSLVLSSRILLLVVRFDTTVRCGVLLVMRIHQVLFDRCCNRLGILMALFGLWAFSCTPLVR